MQYHDDGLQELMLDPRFAKALKVEANVAYKVKLARSKATLYVGTISSVLVVRPSKISRIWVGCLNIRIAQRLGIRIHG